MRRLKRLTQLSAAERRILIRALIAVGAARAALWILPVETARKVVARTASWAVE